MGLIIVDGDFNAIARPDYYKLTATLGELGSGANTFSLTTRAEYYEQLREGYILSEEYPDAGGRVEALNLNSGTGLITVSGHTWLGVLDEIPYDDDTQPPTSIGTVGELVSWLIAYGLPSNYYADLSPWFEAVPDSTPGVGPLTGHTTYAGILKHQILKGAVRFRQSGRKLAIYGVQNRVHSYKDYSEEAFPCKVSISAACPPSGFKRLPCSSGWVTNPEAVTLETLFLWQDGTIHPSGEGGIPSSIRLRGLGLHTEADMGTPEGRLAAIAELENAMAESLRSVNYAEIKIADNRLELNIGDKIVASGGIAGGEVESHIYQILYSESHTGDTSTEYLAERVTLKEA